MIMFPVTKMKWLLLSISVILFGNILHAQYTVNGSAAADNCHCYTITPALNNQSGSVWNNIRIDLRQSFEFNFDAFLGCSDAGADGIVFVLQPISTSVGSTGGGMGFQGISPSVGITIDTWQNTDVGDPVFDHIAIQVNGNIDHASAATNLAGPVTVLPNSDNIEDCSWHSLKIKWDAGSHILSAYVDGALRVSITKDLITDLFGGNPSVFWGFTAGTGGAFNRQQFCTALSPLYKSLSAQKRCVNEPIQFTDSTISFARVSKIFWDFGDGSPVDSVNANPVHTYTRAGDFTIIQSARGADGCVETKTTTLRIGSKPRAGFIANDSCTVSTISFTDTSSVTVGTISQWFWDLGNGTIAAERSPSTSYLTGGNKTIQMLVQTEEGCVSDTAKQSFYVFSRPQISYSVTDSVCLGKPMVFSGAAQPASDTVRLWGWNFLDNNGAVNSAVTTHTFTSAGNHDVVFFASNTGSPACMTMIPFSVFVREKPTASFSVSNVCAATSVILKDSSYSTDNTAISKWWWDLGNGQNSVFQDPAVTYAAADTVIVRLAVQSGTCGSDTLSKPLFVYPLPVASFDHSGLLCEGMPVQFSDSSKVQAGTIAGWSWISQGNEWSNEQNAVNTFSQGNQSVGLQVTSDKGCKSNIAYSNFTVIGKPSFTIDSTGGCKDVAIPFTATDLSGTIQYWQWSFGDGGTAVSKDTQYVYSNGATYTVVLAVTAVDGCTATDSTHVVVGSTDASAAPHTVIAAAGEPVHLNATGGGMYAWSPADGLNSPDIANPVAINETDQQYILRAYTAQGCDSYDTVLIRIYNGPDIYVPSAFHPASQSGNAVLKPIPVGISRFKYFTVFNRYGQVVYSSNSASPGWDGTVNGKPQAPGTYVWMVAGTSFRGREIVKKGTVVLLR